MARTEKPKFEFDLEFQFNILRFTLTDKHGYKALDLYDDTSFTLIEDAIIAKAIKVYYKRKKKLPQERAYLREELRKLFMSPDYGKDLNEEDRKAVLKKVNSLYTHPVKDGDELLENLLRFRCFNELNKVLDNFNAKDFSQYETFATKIQKAITYKNTRDRDVGTFLIADARDRQNQRNYEGSIFPTPWLQLNKLSNSHKGYDKGIVAVILAPQKKFKTGLLINLVKGFLRLKKRILYVDLENGQNSIATRLEQSMINKPKNEVTSGQHDDKILKLFRKYKRIGAEVDIRRFPAYTTTTLDIEAYARKQYREFGIIYDLCIIDYVGNMGSINGDKDDFARISNAYIDVKNLTERMDWESTWTAAHTTREAAKRFATKFEPTDTAKCIDINRHIDLMLGLQQNDQERDQGVIRLELIEQRDGIDHGRCFYWINKENQYMKEFNRAQIDEVMASYKTLDDAPSEAAPKKKRTNGDI